MKNGNKMPRILIVDDDPGQRSLLNSFLRSQHFVVDRELQLRDHRDKLKADIIWNTEMGLKQTPSDIARAHPALREGPRSSLRIVPIALHDLGAKRPKLANFAGDELT